MSNISNLINFKYSNPTIINFGIGKINDIEPLITIKNAKILLIYTPSMEKNGYLKILLSKLNNFSVYLYNNTTPNPTPETVDLVTKLFRSNNCNFIIGIGGGSTIDLAKSVSILQSHKHSSRKYLYKEHDLSNESCPFIAIPSTSGTGSEVTSWATIWDMKNKKKLSLEKYSMYPTHCIVDPELTYSLPKYQTALTGMDALTQSIEAYWSRNSQEISDIYSLTAIKIILENLEDAYLTNKQNSRINMSLGSLLGGLAFSNTKTSICHSLSYPMTIYYNIPHGQAVSITLPSFLEWNKDSLNSKLNPLLYAMGTKSIKQSCDKIRNLMKSIGLKINLSELNINKPDIKNIIREGFYNERADNNPKKILKKDAEKLLNEIL